MTRTITKCFPIEELRDYMIDIDRRLDGKNICGMKISKVKEVYFGEENIGHCASL